MTRNRESLTLANAADWLDLASSVRGVEVETGWLDPPFMCGMAMRYEEQRSDLLSRLATQLSILSFAWGAFETVAKIVDPPGIPATERCQGANSIVDRVIYYIKDHKPFVGFEQAIEAFANSLQQHCDYATVTQSRQNPVYLTRTGEGLDYVRRIRNKLAHGTAAFPIPDRGDSCSDLDFAIVQQSTRVVLFAIQMLLSKRLQGIDVAVDVLHEEDCYDEKDNAIEHSLHYVLERLHLEREEGE